MAETIWEEENTITEVDLSRQSKLGTVTEMTITQVAQGYRVVVRLKWHPGPVALRTRRSNEPRLFKSLERLVAHIRERYPAIRQVRIELLGSDPVDQSRAQKSRGKSPGTGKRKA